jgi:hypothetical protein
VTIQNAHSSEYRVVKTEVMYDWPTSLLRGMTSTDTLLAAAAVDDCCPCCLCCCLCVLLGCACRQTIPAMDDQNQPCVMQHALAHTLSRESTISAAGRAASCLHVSPGLEPDVQGAVIRKQVTGRSSWVLQCSTKVAHVANSCSKTSCPPSLLLLLPSPVRMSEPFWRSFCLSQRRHTPGGCSMLCPGQQPASTSQQCDHLQCTASIKVRTIVCRVSKASFSRVSSLRALYRWC